jgi:hypothetical protein
MAEKDEIRNSVAQSQADRENQEATGTARRLSATELASGSAGTPSPEAPIDRTAEQRMAETFNLLKLPSGLQSDGDPLENIFQNDDPRHEVWKDATRDAAAKIHRRRSDLLENFHASPEDDTSWRVNLALATFDIWAERTVSVVWDDERLDDYDRWLENYAESWMALYASRFSTSESLLSLLESLRFRLIQKTQLWKSIARSFVSERQRSIASASTHGRNEMSLLGEFIAEGSNTPDTEYPTGARPPSMPAEGASVGAGKTATLTAIESNCDAQTTQSHRKKRGRPSTISDESKTKAAQLKANGGTNKQAAEVLYGTKYPSPQQTKNVSSILKHRQKKIERAESASRITQSPAEFHKDPQLKKD